ncbi:centromere protein Q [Mixophyes fleayi]|uniref:centromere protein Q n=1 Tax=Mixophyes fleayi TaxID=3061075 RepID=UPI003F4D799E
MPPKNKTTKVTFVKTKENTANNKIGTKRKKQNSGDQEKTSNKKQCCEPSESKRIPVMKRVIRKPLLPEVLEHIETCIDTAVLSVLSRKKVKAFHAVQSQLSHLKQRLLRHCKTVQVPASKLINLKSIRRDLAEEQRRMKINQDMLESLTQEVEKVVETVNTIEDSTGTLEAKLESLKQRAAGDPQSLGKLNIADPLQLPKSTFNAPTIQENVKKLKNSELVLKELSDIESNPLCKDMLTLIEKSCAEIDAL